MTIERYINVKDGLIENPFAVTKQIADLPDGRYHLRIEPKNKRTLPQNKYVHAVLFPELSNAFIEQGYEPMNAELAKEVAKKLFLTVQIANHDTGEAMEYVKHTSELTTIEMGEFIDSVIRFAAEKLSYVIPMPNEQTKLYSV